MSDRGSKLRELHELKDQILRIDETKRNWAQKEILNRFGEIAEIYKEEFAEENREITIETPDEDKDEEEENEDGKYNVTWWIEREQRFEADMEALRKYEAEYKKESQTEKEDQ